MSGEEARAERGGATAGQTFRCDVIPASIQKSRVESFLIANALAWLRRMQSDPDVIIIAPCGLDIPATKRELPPMTSRPWW